MGLNLDVKLAADQILIHLGSSRRFQQQTTQTASTQTHIASVFGWQRVNIQNLCENERETTGQYVFVQC